MDTFWTPLEALMGDGGWHLSSRTVCPDCGEKIRRNRDSWCAPAPDFVPRHFRCVYPEMAVTVGDEERDG